MNNWFVKIKGKSGVFCVIADAFSWAPSRTCVVFTRVMPIPNADSNVVAMVNDVEWVCNAENHTASPRGTIKYDNSETETESEEISALKSIDDLWVNAVLKRGEDRIREIYAKREELVSAFIAETGYLPSECEILETTEILPNKVNTVVSIRKKDKEHDAAKT